MKSDASCQKKLLKVVGRRVAMRMEKYQGGPGGRLELCFTKSVNKPKGEGKTEEVGRCLWWGRDEGTRVRFQSSSCETKGVRKRLGG
jgi:hypothetical protein